MGNAHALRGRTAPAFILAALLVVVAVVALGAFARPAAALPTFTQAQFGFGPCETCHTKTSVHTNANHAAVYPTCSNCHAGGDVSQPPLPSACGACHTSPATILASASHSTQGCGTTNGCHSYTAAPTITGFTPATGAAGTVVTVTGTQFTSATSTTVLVGGATATAVTVTTPTSLQVTVPAGAVTGPITVTTSGGTIASTGSFTVPPVQATTTLTAKVAPATVAVGKKVKVSGLAGPATALAGAKVGFKVERKVGTKWTKMKTGTATASATGAYSWSYKATKKGAHRVTVTITETTAFTGKKLVKNFKVK